MAASPRDPSGKDAWHEDRSAQLIYFMLHAAALAGASMREVNTWVCAPPSRAPMTILESRDPEWADELAALIAEAGDSLPHVVSSAKAALGWMRDPAMKAAACPLPGAGFTVREFVRSADSAYLVIRKRPYGSAAPYAAALAAEVFEQLRRYAVEFPSGRLPDPATFVLDDMPLTCPWALHDVLADARSYLATVVAAVQTLAQLRAKFGKDDGDTIRSACPVEVFTGGEKRHEDLEAVSAVIGSHDTWHASPEDVRSEPLFPPGALRMLAKGKAVILMPECRPVLATLPVIWKRPGHKRASLAHPALRPALPSLPALEGPRREPIAPPYVPALTAER